MGKSGRQKAEENYRAFIYWIASKDNTEIRQYARGSKLNRTEIAKECGFAKSVLQQNPKVKKALEYFENDLRNKGILCSETGDKPKVVIAGGVSNRAISRRLQAVEEQNAVLKAEVKKLKQKLSQYGLLEEILLETGRIPR